MLLRSFLGHDVPVVMVKLKSDSFLYAESATECKMANAMLSSRFLLSHEQRDCLGICTVIQLTNRREVQNSFDLIRCNEPFLKRTRLLVVEETMWLNQAKPAFIRQQ